MVSLTLAPNADGSYATATAGSSYFSGPPQQALVSASGDEIPAFSAGVPAPLALLLTSPAAPSGGNIIASTTSDLVLNYSRGASGVSLQVQSSGASRSLTCWSDSQLGSLTISHTLLAGLGATNLDLRTILMKQIPAGNSTVSAYFVTDVYTPNQTGVVSVTIQ